MRKSIKPLLQNIMITGIASEGNALARVDGKVLFIPYGIPGDVVNVQVTRARSKFMEGFITEIVKPSEYRIAPFCEHFGLCGGCKWQHLPYSMQLEYKQQQVIDQLKHIGNLSLPEVLPIIGSENTEHYRNKLEFTFSCARWMTKEEIDEQAAITDRSALGFHIPGMFDKVLDIRTCWLQNEPSNAIRLAVKSFAVKNNIPFFDLKQQTGLLRNLIIRTSSIGEVMVIAVMAYDDEQNRNLLMSFLQQNFPQITALMYVINGKRNDSIADLPVHLFAGRGYIEEKMEDLIFKIGPKSFYQTNSSQAYRLYCVVREFSQLQGHETVYDLYTGTGTIANFIARRAKKVVGVEYVQEAIADANENAFHNHIDNTVFYAGDMKDIFSEDFVANNGKPDVIILDPPRAGIHPDIAKTLLRVAAPRIVYVSCNPATQARDLSAISELYEIKKIQPVDMFPHTHHVENVVLAERR